MSTKPISSVRSHAAFLYAVSYNGTPPCLSSLFKVVFQSPATITLEVSVLEIKFSLSVQIKFSCSR